ncbi:MAG: hypothetical protein M3O67_02690 [Bacteroidota bacterium]|nr:hypothetical protein [Bacteroidota bacterium]
MNIEYNNSASGTGDIEERLWNYIDGFSSIDERSTIEKLLVSNIEWKEKYKELLDVHSLMQSAELEEPSMRFTKNVMEKIARYHIAPATKTYINEKLIWGIGIFFISMIVGLVIYGVGIVDWTASDSTNLPVDLSKFDFSKIFSNTYVQVFMMINVVLGLVLLDRYLTNKKEKIKDA